MAIRLSENFRALFYAPFYAAVATGAFKDAGVEVELVPSPEPAAAVAALKAGKVDVMWGGPLRVAISHHDDPKSDLVCFCDVVARDPFFLIGGTPRPDFKLGDNEAAVAAGTLAAAQLFQPYAERLIRSGKGHVWHAAAKRGRTAYTTL